MTDEFALITFLEGVRFILPTVQVPPVLDGVKVITSGRAVDLVFGQRRKPHGAMDPCANERLSSLQRRIPMVPKQNASLANHRQQRMALALAPKEGRVKSLQLLARSLDPKTRA